MFINLDRPLVVFDLETTGLFPKRDRIIELGAIKVMPDGTEEERCWLLNPGIPIPPESTAVHGIADEDVKDCPTFADKADEIYAFFEGCDLSGRLLLRRAPFAETVIFPRVSVSTVRILLLS